MDAPAVQYVTTSDGYNIAYTVSGEGRPFVFMPADVNHVQLHWTFASSSGPWLESARNRFRLIQYDSRGQGMSTRGLKPDFVMADYETDLDAILQRLDPGPIVLLGIGRFGHAAIRYALNHPQRVVALVLLHTALSMREAGVAFQLGLARENWDMFINSIGASSRVSAEDRAAYPSGFREMTTQADWLLTTEAALEADISDVVGRIRVPTLLLRSREYVGLSADAAIRLAAQIPSSRLVVIDGPSFFPSAPIAFEAIDAFLAEIRLPWRQLKAKRAPCRSRPVSQPVRPRSSASSPPAIRTSRSLMSSSSA
jgi:pimeloyl-ACP methyl ester carboxylesterase